MASRPLADRCRGHRPRIRRARRQVRGGGRPAGRRRDRRSRRRPPRARPQRGETDQRGALRRLRRRPDDRDRAGARALAIAACRAARSQHGRSHRARPRGATRRRRSTDSSLSAPAACPREISRFTLAVGRALSRVAPEHRRPASPAQPHQPRPGGGGRVQQRPARVSHADPRASRRGDARRDGSGRRRTAVAARPAAGDAGHGGRSRRSGMWPARLRSCGVAPTRR